MSRICQSCGLENPDENDFCSCGEYLRWEPTNVLSAVQPSAPPPAAPPAPEPAPPAADAPPAAATPPRPSPPPAAARRAAPAPPPSPPREPTRAQAAVPPPPAPEQPAEATITLRLPDEEAEKGQALAIGVHPGDRVRVLALVRNQSGIVDNYQLRVEGMPPEWWTVFPDTVYLVPYGTGGTYEQEVELHLHPPRKAEAEARIWPLEVAAHSRATNKVAATAPLMLGIHPFEDHEVRVRPERASGRRKAKFNVSARNRSNAPALIAFDASEADGDCAFAFAPASLELQPGETATTQMTAAPPRQIWIGRPHERRIEVKARTGDAAAALLATSGQEKDASGFTLPNLPGVQKPQLLKGGMQDPALNIGPDGINFRQPQFRAPQLRGPHVNPVNLDLRSLRTPGQAPPAVTGPLAPSQAVFRQRPWLPWWLAPLIPLLAAAIALLLLLSPKDTSVVVPDLVGKTSAFAAEQSLTQAKLKLAPGPQNEVDPKVTAGTIIKQTPAAGAKADEGALVTVLVAVGDGTVDVPDVTGKNLADAESTLRAAGLSLGQSSPQPVDPAGKIATQIPAAKEVVKQGEPVNVFFAVAEPAAAGKKDAKGGGSTAAAAAGGGGAGGGGAGGGGGGPIVIPAVGKDNAAAYAQKLSGLGLLPDGHKAFDASPVGTVFGVIPETGSEAKAGAKVAFGISAGFPQVVFDTDTNVQRINGATGKPLEPVASGAGDQHDPAWSPDGTSVAYVDDGRVMLQNVVKPGTDPLALTAEGEFYADPAWAPTTKTNVLALTGYSGDPQADGTTSDLCLGRISDAGMRVRCKSEPGFSIERQIRWSPDGKMLLAFGFKGTEFGIVRWRSSEPYAADPDAWSKGRFVTDTSKPGEGVLDASISPDGTRMAVTKIGSSGRSELFVTKPGDWDLTSARRMGVLACKAVWRPDGRELLVVQADNCLTAPTGLLLRVPLDNPSQQRKLRLVGDNPSFQPLTAN